jgi:membrane-associated phospholipid phosphatase
VPTDLFTRINDLARGTPWLHGPVTAYASFGLLLFGGLLVAGWWVARRRDDRTMAGALLAPVLAVVAVVAQQPVITWAGHPRPFVVHPDALVLVARSADSSFPSDHACVVGAVTAALFFVDRRLAVVSGVLALLMAFARVYVGAHWPVDVVAGLLFGAGVATIGVLLLRTPVSRVVARARASRLVIALGTGSLAR